MITEKRFPETISKVWGISLKRHMTSKGTEALDQVDSAYVSSPPN